MVQAQQRSDEPRQTQKRIEEAADAAANFIPTEFVELSKKRVEALMQIQRELFDAFQEINQAWFERARSEADLNSELVKKLTAARSMPETADACQHVMGKRIEMLVEDSRRMLADGQKIVNLSTKFLANGSHTNGSAA